ncbi:shikimate dehydrogenase family protein [Chryseobacterium sp.]|uniref:shikimate dehydrogenase family protein n=1 Tax=Chryseobacterium sp. TaxID=1871047 RepID=UPI0011C8D78A|nr:shikimate dehydrogenase [Chryseobacterium sp.]TXF77815.1 shikimate dehydrogenase [Chryseobacterium sp.]
MEATKRFGLIGRNISYSFSKNFFEEKFMQLSLENHSYGLFDMEEIDEVENLLNDPEMVGLNVTIPYKEKIIAFLDELSEEAEKIGAVNCIHIKYGKKTGYNTDAFGFERTMLLHKENFHHNALVLGNGGAAKAIRYVLEKNGIPYQTVARNTNLSFENLTERMVAENQIIIQCTPVGTFPDVEKCLTFPFGGLSEKHLVIDLIYNPSTTLFLKKAGEKGSKTVNGYYMLEQQAEKAWEIWNF